MLKNRKIVALFTAMLLGVFPFLFAGSSVHAAEVNYDAQDQETIERMAEELEYILSEIIIENPETGRYSIDENGLNASPYSQSEKENLIFFAEFLNDPTIIEEPAGEVSIQSNKFTRCLADAGNIGKAAVNEIARYIKEGKVIAAAGALFTAAKAATTVGSNKALTIAAAASFIALCGPMVVS